MIDEKMHCYNELIRTIFNVDDKDDTNGIICVYDLKNDEQLIAIFTKAKDCAIFFRTTARSMSSIISRNEIYRKRFKIVRLGKGWENE